VIEPLLNIASKTIITYNQKERVDDVEIVPFYEWVFNA